MDVKGKDAFPNDVYQ